MAAGITYGGYPLLTADTGSGELLAFFRTMLDPDEFGLLGHKPVATANGHWRPTNAKYRRRGGLSVPNYPPAPTKFKLNSLYWPTGASRWAICYVLVDGETLKLIHEESNEFSESLNLAIDDGVSTPVVPSMYALPPRRVNAVSGLEDKQKLYILPLVDQRWFWQFKHSGELDKPDDVTTWAQLYSWLGTRLGVTISADTVSTDYGEPDRNEIERWHDSPAMMLDAVAHSVGQRILCYPNDDTVTAESWSSGEENLQANQDNEEWRQIAGFTFDAFDAHTVRDGKRWRDGLTGITPEKVLVTFPIIRRGVPSNTLADSLRAMLSKEVDESSFDGPDGRVVAGTFKVFHTCYAGRYEFSDTSASNDADLEALANKIAEDFYDSLAHSGMDFVFAGILSWLPTPWDDHVEWSFGTPIDGDTAVCKTTVVPAPYNLGIEDTAHSDGTEDEDGPLISFITQETFTTSDATVSVKIEHWDGGAWDVVGDAFDVYNHVGRFSGSTSGLHGEARWDETRQGYLIIQMDCG